MKTLVSKISRMNSLFFAVVLFLAVQNDGRCAEISDISQECISCHEGIHPGIVASWKKSRHAQTSPSEAFQKPKLEQRVSSKTIPDSLKTRAIGCYECHSLNINNHKDAFDHNGYKIQIVVSPNDCAVCHSVEHEQYKKKYYVPRPGQLDKQHSLP